MAELVELEWMFSRLYMSEGSTSHAALLPVLHDDDGQRRTMALLCESRYLVISG